MFGLSVLPMHMKRALGTLTPFETFKKATEIKLGAVDDLDETIPEGSDESRETSADEAVVSSSIDSL